MIPAVIIMKNSSIASTAIITYNIIFKTVAVLIVYQVYTFSTCFLLHDLNINVLFSVHIPLNLAM